MYTTLVSDVEVESGESERIVDVNEWKTFVIQVLDGLVLEIQLLIKMKLL